MTTTHPPAPKPCDPVRLGQILLNLVSSKRLAELMGGEMGGDSQPNQGSTFWFTVKLAKVATSTS